MSLIISMKPPPVTSDAAPYRTGVKPAPRALLRRAAKAVLCAFAVIISCNAATAQISPGPLSPAHAEFDHLTQCQTCHKLALGSRSFKCLDCHTEIGSRLDGHHGFHSAVTSRQAGDTNCVRCHSEHTGEGASIIRWEPSQRAFDHSKTGFLLEGKHATVACRECHTAAHISAANRGSIKVKDLNRTFLGLTRDCATCHTDPHQNQLGNHCNDCHTPAAWKPATGFDHSRTPFPLTGLHRQVPCEKCHDRSSAAQAVAKQAAGGGATPGGNVKVRLFKGLSFNGCQSCHQDPHHNAFQAVQVNGKCAGCHNTDGWKKTRAVAVFNHDMTKFPLIGKHADVPCEKCHKGDDFHRPIPHDRCRDCHEDPHGGQFASRPAGSDCSACHSPVNFKPALFDREAHRHTAFPLEGMHATLQCQQCHKPAGPNARYKTGKLRCAECHADPHGGEFAREPFNNRCEMCHTVGGFMANTFSIERHARTRFPLTGSHLRVPCEKCHALLMPPTSDAAQAGLKTALTEQFLASADKPEYAQARRHFRFASYTCNTCHVDPHRLDPQLDLTCETCHISDSWKMVQPFDHSRTGFKLEGAHANEADPIACVECHKMHALANDPNTVTPPIFSNAPTECSQCHINTDPHGGQFSMPVDRRRDCSSCHLATGWRAGGFDHDSTSFPLFDHRDVQCEKCHKDWREIDGKSIRVFRGTPVTCQMCH